MARLTDQAEGAERIDVCDDFTTIIDAVQIDDAPTSYNSAMQSTPGMAGALVLIAIDSTLAPTNLRVLAQYTDDGGTTYWDFEEGLWASLYWEDTDTTSGVHKAFNLPLYYPDWRIRIVGTGTDATNYFTVTVKYCCYSDAVGVAHA
jgi:hypothetical protein